MWLTLGKNFLSMFMGVSNARVRDGILLVRYKVVKMASPQYCLGTPI